MKFLIDVNTSGPLVRWLMDMGHDVVRVADRDLRMSDEDILRWAVREQRIVITTNKDFEEMIWREGTPHSTLCVKSDGTQSVRAGVPTQSAWERAYQPVFV